MSNISGGKTTIRTVFKNTSDKTAFEVSIESNEREIENLEVLLDLVTINLANKVLPVFKRDKYNIYRQMMKSLSVAEINNAHSVAKFWSLVGENKNVVQAVMNPNQP